MIPYPPESAQERERRERERIEGAHLNEYTHHIALCIQHWAQLTKPDLSHAETGMGLYCDLSHSALFSRLLSGKKPLPTPPPTSFSYPWYELLDDGHVESVEVWFDEQGGLVINQNGQWQLIEKQSDDEYVIAYGETLRCRLYRAHPEKELFQWSLTVLPEATVSPEGIENTSST
jgi:hypothetical protein